MLRFKATDVTPDEAGASVFGECADTPGQRRTVGASIRWKVWRAGIFLSGRSGKALGVLLQPPAIQLLWISRFSRRVVPGLSASRQRLPDRHPALDTHRCSGALERCGSRKQPGA